ncbi:hypothetical protein [Pelagicoccus sp. SDUM812003]|uniref:hypothetical protein n=1 Tax=Pelagicoccus sp. SDUM812003 TaxID=3041267 RepID=UPI00280E408E|nr:hypothetical protein [Pelagicoccus sp. SDUM812003]MDQ8202382.1 hypothetical protein [Pelagicoccus sp. SDUM812003]
MFRSRALARLALACQFLLLAAPCFSQIQIKPVPGGVCSLDSQDASRRRVTLYDSRDGSPKGWSHIAEHPDRFPLVKLPARRYAVDESALVSADDCPQRQVFRTVLVRKLSDWDQQHANGIEPLFYRRPIRVGDLESVSIVVRFHREGSSIPSERTLRDHYGDFLSERQIEGLDRGLACLGLSFLGAGYNDQSEESLNAVALVAFDPDTDFDKWLRVTVPVSAFVFGFEKNYAFREVDRASVLERELIGFRINPESTGGIVARNYLVDTWDGSLPELYKELSLSLASIEARLFE